MKKTLNSTVTMEGRRMAGARALWRAAGMKPEQMGRPVVAIANSFTQFVPGHTHLHEAGQIVKAEVERLGCYAAEFNTVAVDDGIAMGHDGMLYSLPSRELIADSVEYMVRAHRADALVCSLFGSPLMTSLAATGKIRNYQVAVSLIILLSIPVAYVLLRSGMEPETVYYVTIVFSAVSGFARFFFARRQIGFSVRRFISSVLLRVAGMLAVSLPLPLYLRLCVLTVDSWWTFLILCSVSVVCTGISAWTVALDRTERDSMGRMLKDWTAKLAGRRK